MYIHIYIYIHIFINFHLWFSHFNVFQCPDASWVRCRRGLDLDVRHFTASQIRRFKTDTNETHMIAWYFDDCLIFWWLFDDCLFTQTLCRTSHEFSAERICHFARFRFRSLWNGNIGRVLEIRIWMSWNWEHPVRLGWTKSIRGVRTKSASHILSHLVTSSHYHVVTVLP